MKILIIFTGGTIGSTRHGDIISVDGSKPRIILDKYEQKFGIDFEYSTLEPYTELSENNTGEHIKKLSACLCENLNCGYDGIIITHGTDSLQYSAAALGFSVGSDTIPICVVSANRPVDNEKSNALDNLRGAVKFIEGKYGRGVFVPYKNDKGDLVKIHRATRLVASRAFSDEVESIYECEYGHFDSNFAFQKNPLFSESEDKMPSLDASRLDDMSNAILSLNSYVGMAYPTLNESTKYILLSSYHSGTINTKSSTSLEFFKRAAELGIKVYLTGVSNAPAYESTAIFKELCIIPLKNISPIAAYIKLWLLSSNKMDTDKYLPASLGGDIDTQDYSLTY